MSYFISKHVYLRKGYYSSLIMVVSVFFGSSSLIAGASASHYLGDFLDARDLEIFETAVRFQMYHSIILLIIGSLHTIGRKINILKLGLLEVAATFVGIGIIMFSGSLYILAITDSVNWIGPLTPLGGVLLISGWLCLALAAFNSYSKIELAGT